MEEVSFPATKEDYYRYMRTLREYTQRGYFPPNRNSFVSKGLTGRCSVKRVTWAGLRQCVIKVIAIYDLIKCGSLGTNAPVLMHWHCLCLAYKRCSRHCSYWYISEEEMLACNAQWSKHRNWVRLKNYICKLLICWNWFWSNCHDYRSPTVTTVTTLF